MKPFKFSLQSLYDVKQSVEEQQKLQLKVIENRIAQIEREIAQLNENRVKHYELYEEDLNQGMAAHKLAGYGRFFDLLNVTEALLKERLAGVRKERQQCMEVLIEMRKEIKALQKLSEIELAAYKELVSKEEDNIIGDMITYKVATK